METFTLLYPNVVEVAGVIYGLYPDIPMENVRAVMDAMTRYAGFYR
jgi:hypothetical protein